MNTNYLSAQEKEAFLNHPDLMECGLTREYVREDKGLLKTIVYFRVEGPARNLLFFKAAVCSAIDEAA